MALKGREALPPCRLSLFLRSGLVPGAARRRPVAAVCHEAFSKL